MTYTDRRTGGTYVWCKSPMGGQVSREGWVSVNLPRPSCSFDTSYHPSNVLHWGLQDLGYDGKDECSRSRS